MRTVDDPRKLFRRIDVTNIDSDEDSYTYKVEQHKVDVPEEPSDVMNSDRGQIMNHTIHFDEFSDEDEEMAAALEELRGSVDAFEELEGVPDGADAQFITEEDGEKVAYVADTSRLGYEAVRRYDDPKKVGFTVVFPDRVAKIPV